MPHDIKRTVDPFKLTKNKFPEHSMEATWKRGVPQEIVVRGNAFDTDISDTAIGYWHLPTFKNDVWWPRASLEYHRGNRRSNCGGW